MDDDGFRSGPADGRPVRGHAFRVDPVPLLVLAGSVIVALAAYLHYLPQSRSFWTNTGHDRQAHYFIGVRLAADIRDGAVLTAMKDVLMGSGVWGPLYGVLEASALLVGGFNHQRAVLPSLAGLVAAAIFGFLGARRAVPRFGNIAGLAAAVFILASPAHRAFATDIMLESVGAALSLMVVWCYLATVQDDRRWASRGLGLALTLLFFHKSNYYMLAAASLVTAELLSRGRIYAKLLGDHLRQIDGRKGLMLLYRPLHLLAGAILLVALAIWVHGPEPIVVAGRSMRVYPPWNLVTIAYAFCFISLAVWWYRHGLSWSREQDRRVHDVIVWHVWPVLVNFLIPGHFKDFLGYLSRNHGRDGFDHPWLGGLPYYAERWLQDYHLGWWSMSLAAGLAVLAVAGCRRLRPGAAGVIVFAVVAGLLTIYHPSHRSRFLHSWIAVIWVLSGIGLAQVIALLPARPRFGSWLGTAIVAVLVLLHAPGMFRPGHAPEAAPTPGEPSLLDVTDAYLAFLDGGSRVTILSSVPLSRYLVDATFLERYPRSRLESHWFGFGPRGDANRRGFRHWLETTRCSTIVFVERLPECRRYSFETEDHLVQEEMLEVLRDQDEFQEIAINEFPRYGCRVSIWSRMDGGNSAEPVREAGDHLLPFTARTD